MMKFGKREAVAVLGEVSQLAQFEGRRVVVGGRLTYVPSADEKLIGGHFALAPRDAGKTLRVNLRKSAPRLRIYAREELFLKPKLRYAFLLDAYLAYGLQQQKGEQLLAIIGGIESADERFPVNVLIFNKVGLLESREHTLPAPSHHSFASDCSDIVHGLRKEYEGIRVVVAGPLSPWTGAEVEYAELPLARLAFKPLTAAKAVQEQIGVPALAVAAGLAVFGGLTAHGWNAFNAAVERFQVASQDPSIKKQGGVDNNYVNVMTQRRKFLDAPRRQELLAHKTMDIIRGIGALKEVQIVEIRMPAPSVEAREAPVGITPAAQDLAAIGPGRAPDVWMRISVPKAPGPALYQAKEVIRSLIATTGMSIRTAGTGWVEEGARRVFVLEGFIHA